MDWGAGTAQAYVMIADTQDGGSSRRALVGFERPLSYQGSSLVRFADESRKNLSDSGADRPARFPPGKAILRVGQQTRFSFPPQSPSVGHRPRATRCTTPAGWAVARAPPLTAGRTGAELALALARRVRLRGAVAPAVRAPVAALAADRARAAPRSGRGMHRHRSAPLAISIAW